MAAGKSSAPWPADARGGRVEGGEEGALLVGLGPFRVGAVGVFDAVLGLGLGEEVGGALEALEEVGAVLGLEERRQRLGPPDEEDEVVVPRHGEAGVDDVVPDALVAEVDFQAVVEEGEEVWSRTSPNKTHIGTNLHILQLVFT
jgi:hypothetical protein